METLESSHFMSNNLGILSHFGMCPFVKLQQQVVVTNPPRSNIGFFIGSSNHCAIRLVVSRMRDPNLLFTELGEVYI